MKLIHTGKYYDIFLDEPNLMQLIWKSTTEAGDGSEFKAWNNKLTDLTAEHRPKFMLSDCTDYLFVITPDLQEWSVANVFDRFRSAGLERLAILVSKELFSQVSLEQFTEEGEFLTRYFEDRDKALEWLNE